MSLLLVLGRRVVGQDHGVLPPDLGCGGEGPRCPRARRSGPRREAPRCPRARRSGPRREAPRVSSRGSATVSWRWRQPPCVPGRRRGGVPRPAAREAWWGRQCGSHRPAAPAAASRTPTTMGPNDSGAQALLCRVTSSEVSSTGRPRGAADDDGLGGVGLADRHGRAALAGCRLAPDVGLAEGRPPPSPTAPCAGPSQ